LGVGGFWQDGFLVADPLLGCIIPKLSPNVGGHLFNGGSHHISIFAFIAGSNSEDMAFQLLACT
jgi:hypothetical protein